jgi:hypothetical protein
LGYPEDLKGWKLWDPRNQRIVISRDIIRNEEEFPGNSHTIVPYLGVLSEPEEEPLPRQEDDDKNTPDVVGAEPVHVRALLAQGLRSVYDLVKY